MDVTKIMAGDREPKWFRIPTGGENEPEVLVRTPAPKRMREISKRAGVANVRRFDENDLSNDRFLSGLCDYMIIDWKNIRSELNGESVELPCTRENKIVLMDNWLEFFSVVLDVLNASRVDAEVILEDGRGN